MSRSFFKNCPRCGTRHYEQLSTHGHCVECLYSSDFYDKGKVEFVSVSEDEKILKETEQFAEEEI